LRCALNLIGNLDVSNNLALTSLSCYDNQLISLNVKNQNNSAIAFFDASNNPLLYCIEVDDAIFSTNNWSNIDSIAVFSENCLTGIQNNDIQKSILIYPNPTIDILYFSAISNGIISDFAGKILVEIKNSQYANLSNLASGVYIITLTDNTGQVIKRSKIVRE